MGQFGLIGLILMILIVFKFYQFNFRAVRKNEYFYFTTLLMAGFLLASSIASKSYSEFTTIPVFLLHGILTQRELAARTDTQEHRRPEQLCMKQT
jgi:hypothetical protein